VIKCSQKISRFSEPGDFLFPVFLSKFGTGSPFFQQFFRVPNPDRLGIIRKLWSRTFCKEQDEISHLDGRMSNERG
jgi:hypothetical protein